ncbi:hypothetical protein [Streptomyces sp. NPDC086010]
MADPTVEPAVVVPVKQVALRRDGRGGTGCDPIGPLRPGHARPA